MNDEQQKLAQRSTEWLDRFWDDAARLIRFPSDYSTEEVRTPQVVPPGVKHGVRETSWYVIGLLIRNRPGDDPRAKAALRRIMALQFNEPGAEYHGTFFRYPQEPHPNKSSVCWKDYDPNWRQFIGSTLAVLLDHFTDRFDSDLICAMERSIQLAVIGETDRVTPSYTNIALMKASLDVWAGARFGRDDWVARGNEMGDAVYALFLPNQTFCEYNSPTYYGVNLFALRNWRSSSSSKLREHAVVMEAELWRDIARFYHAGLRNLCGPFDRAYGMNMLDYAAVTGLWIWLETGEKAAPYPNLDKPFEHRHDICPAPLIALLGAEIPADVVPHLHSFQQSRQVERAIENNRVATAWLDHHVMLGGQRGNSAVHSQFHPATIHWLTPLGVGTLHLKNRSPVDAIADRNGLRISGTPVREATKCSLEIQLPGGQAIDYRDGVLALPGLRLAIETDLAEAYLQGTSLTFQIPAMSVWHLSLQSV